MSESVSPNARASAAQGRSRHQGWGLLAGVLIAALVYLLVPATQGEAARIVAAIAMLMATWWVTEALPIPVTSLLPLVLFPLTGIAPLAEVSPAYANPVVFLVLGGVMLGLAVQRWQLHLRIALHTIAFVGTQPRRIVFGTMCASFLISMWVSNTATAVIMMPIGIAVIQLVESLEPASASPKFRAAMLLGIAYAITLGATATLIGQPPMAMMRAYLEQQEGIVIGFGQWMLFGLPFSLVMMLAAYLVLARMVFAGSPAVLERMRVLLKEKIIALGPISGEEKRVLMVFALAIFCWLVLPVIVQLSLVQSHAPWLGRLDDASVAILAAILLFVIPAPSRRGERLLDWEAARDIPWGILLLFGGGLALSFGITHSGLSAWIASAFQSLGEMPEILFVLTMVTVLVLLTELASNTAMAAAFLPIMGAVAHTMGIDPLLMAVTVTLAVSAAFMLPAATPSNAVAFATGKITIEQMIRAGLWLSLLAILVITAFVQVLAPYVFAIP